MTEIERIVDQLNRAFVGEAWHGPAVIEILEGVTAQQAVAHPLAGGHSIWELTLHLAAWMRAVLRRLHGDPAQLTDAEIFQRLQTRASEHGRSAELLQAHKELRRNASFDDFDLTPIIEGMSSIYVTAGVIQHSLYHAGRLRYWKAFIKANA